MQFSSTQTIETTKTTTTPNMNIYENTTSKKFLAQRDDEEVKLMSANITANKFGTRTQVRSTSILLKFFNISCHNMLLYKFIGCK